MEGHDPMRAQYFGAQYAVPPSSTPGQHTSRDHYWDHDYTSASGHLSSIYSQTPRQDITEPAGRDYHYQTPDHTSNLRYVEPSPADHTSIARGLPYTSPVYEEDYNLHDPQYQLALGPHVGQQQHQNNAPQYTAQSTSTHPMHAVTVPVSSFSSQQPFDQNYKYTTSNVGDPFNPLPSITLPTTMSGYSDPPTLPPINAIPPHTVPHDSWASPHHIQPVIPSGPPMFTANPTMSGGHHGFTPWPMSQLHQQPQAKMAPVRTEPNFQHRDLRGHMRDHFARVYEGRLGDAAQSLVTVASLVHDTAQYHNYHVDPQDTTITGGRHGQPDRNARIQWWDLVNNSWLTLLQRQLEWSSSKQALHNGQSLLDMAALEKIGDEVVELSEKLFQYGQVDIQSGIDEARIIDEIIKCCEILDPTRGAECKVEEANSPNIDPDLDRPMDTDD